MKTYLWLELVLLFFVLPLGYAVGLVEVHVLLTLLILALACLAVLWHDRSFDRNQLWNRNPLRRELKRVLTLFVVNAAVLGVGVALVRPDLAFSFVRRTPVIWAVVMLLYPLVSVYPQELVYRTFFFHRYGRLLSGRWTMLTVNAAAFGWMHIVFGNWPAVCLSLVGGALFAWTYQRTRSTLAVTLEHALYGCYIFTIGLGHFFYKGA